MDQSNRLESGGRRELAQGFESSTLRHIKRRSDGMEDVTSSNLVVLMGVRVQVAPSAPFFARTELTRIARLFMNVLCVSIQMVEGLRL